jgi:hypothetical protein
MGNPEYEGYEGAVWTDVPEQTSFDIPEGQPQLTDETLEAIRREVDEAFDDFGPIKDPGVQ